MSITMTKCKLGTTDLPLNFWYQPKFVKRLSIEDTLSAKVIQQDAYYTGDETFEFKLEYTTSTFRDLFKAAFIDTANAVAFIDYDGTTFYVILTIFSTEEVAGYFNLSGEFQRVLGLSGSNLSV